MSPSLNQDHELLLTQTVAPTEEPVTLAEAKAHCRIDHIDDDTLIAGLITAATSHLDYENGILGQALVTQTWSYSLPGPDALERVHLPVTPVVALTSMSYYDTDNASQSITTANYHILKGKWTARIIPNDGTSWPTMFARADALTVIFTAGFGAATAVPQSVKQAMLLLIAHWYENRESSIVGTSIDTVPMAFDALIAPIRRVFM
jgi:uncharacterized phiE125 gp8 family phage protein